LRTGRTKCRPVSGSRNGVSDSEAVTGRRSKQIQDMPLHAFILRKPVTNFAVTLYIKINITEQNSFHPPEELVCLYLKNQTILSFTVSIKDFKTSFTCFLYFDK